MARLVLRFFFEEAQSITFLTIELGRSEREEHTGTCPAEFRWNAGCGRSLVQRSSDGVKLFNLPQQCFQVMILKWAADPPGAGLAQP